MSRKFVTRVSDSIGKIVSQKVDYIATVVQPLIYTQGDEDKSGQVGV